MKSSDIKDLKKATAKTQSLQDTLYMMVEAKYDQADELLRLMKEERDLIDDDDKPAHETICSCLEIVLSEIELRRARRAMDQVQIQGGLS